MDSILETTTNARWLPSGSQRWIRTDVPYRLNDRDIDWLRGHKVMTVVDLRGAVEQAKKPCPLAHLPDFAYHHLPLAGGDRVPATPEDVGPFYLAMLDDTLARAIRVLEAADRAIFFCNAGKDRTGVVSALLLRRCGVDDDTIVKDYLITAQTMAQRIARFVAQNPHLDITVLTPQERYMREFLAGSLDWQPGM